MSRLLKDLVGSIQYDSSWGIWAELIDGKFTPQSEARYGQKIFENGGLLDDFAYFYDGVQIGDNYISWFDGIDESDIDHAQKEDWIEQLIEEKNEELNEDLN